MERRLYRSETDCMLGGVCGGLAEYFDVDAVWVRLIFVLLTLAGGVGLIAYIVLWVIMPRQSRVGAIPREVVRENVEQIKERAKELGEEIKTSFSGESPSAPQEQPSPPLTPRPRAAPPYLLGTILIVIGAIFLLNNLGLFQWWNLGRLWPLILVIIGIVFLLRRKGAER